MKKINDSLCWFRNLFVVMCALSAVQVVMAEEVDWELNNPDATYNDLLFENDLSSIRNIVHLSSIEACVPEGLVTSDEPLLFDDVDGEDVVEDSFILNGQTIYFESIRNLAFNQSKDMTECISHLIKSKSVDLVWAFENIKGLQFAFITDKKATLVRASDGEIKEKIKKDLTIAYKVKGGIELVDADNLDMLPALFNVHVDYPKSKVTVNWGGEDVGPVIFTMEDEELLKELSLAFQSDKGDEFYVILNGNRMLSDDERNAHNNNGEAVSWDVIDNFGEGSFFDIQLLEIYVDGRELSVDDKNPSVDVEWNEKNSQLDVEYTGSDGHKIQLTFEGIGALRWVHGCNVGRSCLEVFFDEEFAIDDDFDITEKTIDKLVVGFNGEIYQGAEFLKELTQITNDRTVDVSLKCKKYDGEACALHRIDVEDDVFSYTFYVEDLYNIVLNDYSQESDDGAIAIQLGKKMLTFSDKIKLKDVDKLELWVNGNEFSQLNIYIDFANSDLAEDQLCVEKNGIKNCSDQILTVDQFNIPYTPITWSLNSDFEIVEEAGEKIDHKVLVKVGPFTASKDFVPFSVNTPNATISINLPKEAFEYTYEIINRGLGVSVKDVDEEGDFVEEDGTVAISNPHAEYDFGVHVDGEVQLIVLEHDINLAEQTKILKKVDKALTNFAEYILEGSIDSKKVEKKIEEISKKLKESDENLKKLLEDYNSEDFQNLMLGRDVGSVQAMGDLLDKHQQLIDATTYFCTTNGLVCLGFTDDVDGEIVVSDSRQFETYLESVALANMFSEDYIEYNKIANCGIQVRFNMQVDGQRGSEDLLSKRIGNTDDNSQQTTIDSVISVGVSNKVLRPQRDAFRNAASAADQCIKNWLDGERMESIAMCSPERLASQEVAPFSSEVTLSLRNTMARIGSGKSLTMHELFNQEYRQDICDAAAELDDDLQKFTQLNVEVKIRANGGPHCEFKRETSDVFDGVKTIRTVDFLSELQVGGVTFNSLDDYCNADITPDITEDGQRLLAAVHAVKINRALAAAELLKHQLPDVVARAAGQFALIKANGADVNFGGSFKDFVFLNPQTNSSCKLATGGEASCTLGEMESKFLFPLSSLVVDDADGASPVKLGLYKTKALEDCESCTTSYDVINENGSHDEDGFHGSVRYLHPQPETTYYGVPNNKGGLTLLFPKHNCLTGYNPLEGTHDNKENCILGYTEDSMHNGVDSYPFSDFVGGEYDEGSKQYIGLPQAGMGFMYLEDDDNLWGIVNCETGLAQNIIADILSASGNHQIAIPNLDDINLGRCTPVDNIAEFQAAVNTNAGKHAGLTAGYLAASLFVGAGTGSAVSAAGTAYASAQYVAAAAYATVVLTDLGLMTTEIALALKDGGSCGLSTDGSCQTGALTAGILLNALGFMGVAGDLSDLAKGFKLTTFYDALMPRLDLRKIWDQSKRNEGVVLKQGKTVEYNANARGSGPSYNRSKEGGYMGVCTQG